MLRYILRCLMVLQANSKGPDQTARMRSLIRPFTVRIDPRTVFDCWPICCPSDDIASEFITCHVCTFITHLLICSFCFSCRL